MHRVMLLSCCLAALCAGAQAGRLEQVLAQGPYPHLPGIVLRQQVGNVTAGAFAAPAAGDWSGDGHDDIIIGSGYGDLLYFERRADGFLAEPVQMMPEPPTLIPRPPASRPISPAIADWDGDGRPDLIVGMGGSVYFCRRTPEGLASPVELMVNGRGVGEAVRALSPSAGHLAPCAVDLDLDGALDLLLGDDEGNVWWLKGAATGGAPRLHPPARLAPGGRTLDVGARARPAVGDWTGNGYPDLFIGSAAGTVYWCEGSAAGLSAPRPWYGTGAAVGAPDTASLRDVAPAFSSWYGPERGPRVLVGDRRGFVALLAPDEGGRPRAEGYLQGVNAPVDVGRCAAAYAVDWNANGRLDLVVGGEDGYVHLFQRVADDPPTFAAGRRVAGREGPIRAAPRPGIEEHLRFAWPCVADVDRDGDLDLLLGQADGRVGIYLNNAGLRHAGVVSVAGRDLALPGLSTVHAVDYDQDGDLDLFVGTRLAAGLTAPGRLWPEGIIYLENVAAQEGRPPLFVKAVRMDAFIVPPGGASARDADVLGISAMQPVNWRRRGALDFLVTTRFGAYILQTDSSRRSYPRLELRSEASGIPPPLMPPAWSHMATPLVGREVGILCGMEEFGWVVWHERRALPVMGRR